MMTKLQSFTLYSLLAVMILLLNACTSSRKSNEEMSKKPVIIAYVGGYRGLADIENISANKITHINYAFVNVEDGKAILTNLATDSINLRNLNALKKQNPDLKILISLGGWTWSGNFSDAMLTPESREIFAQSSVDIIDEYNLDGIDVDWEYPAIAGLKGNIYRPEDRENYTLMFQALREKLNILEQSRNKKYLLTTAVGGFQKFIDNTNMADAQQYLDYVNIMTYTFSPEEQATHHTNLYASDKITKPVSADIAVKAFAEAGVPYEKLVMGISFYGKGYQVQEGAENGLGDTFISTTRVGKGGGFTFLKDSMENKDGFIKYWDESAHAPYMFNKEKGIFITYDDERSVKEKCEYVKEHNMGGVMFWEYSYDPKEYLLDAINESFE